MSKTKDDLQGKVEAKQKKDREKKKRDWFPAKTLVANTDDLQGGGNVPHVYVARAISQALDQIYEEELEISVENGIGIEPISHDGVYGVKFKFYHTQYDVFVPEINTEYARRVKRYLFARPELENSDRGILERGHEADFYEQEDAAEMVFEDMPEKKRGKVKSPEYQRIVEGRRAHSDGSHVVGTYLDLMSKGVILFLVNASIEAAREMMQRFLLQQKK